MTRHRVVVTGIGGLCALGSSAGEIWTAMVNGQPGIGPLPDEIDKLKISTGGVIRSLPEHSLTRQQTVLMDRFSLLAVLAAGEAIRQSGLAIGQDGALRTGAVIGTGIFGASRIDHSYRELFVNGRQRVDVMVVPQIMPGAPAGQVSMVYNLKGPVFGVTSACSSANHAFASAVDILRAGRADVMIAGGTDAPLVYGVLKGWEVLRVVSRDTCRPFSADRSGLVIGEGAGAVVLETLEHAQRRGATILAELAGAGMSADAADIVAPTVEGPTRAMQACLDDAGLDASDIQYVNAHGTGTKLNDRVETEAIKNVFGSHSANLSVSSTKSMHAHCLGASGALELIACIGALQHGIIPPTINYNEPDPQCDLDVTPNHSARRNVNAAISNSFAFGGTNAVVALKSF